MIDASSSAATLAPVGLPERILEGTMRCIAETGVAKTTIDDIARAAGCGRATVYRVFPGGRDAVLAAAGRREVERFLAGLGAELDACPSLEDALVRGITRTARQFLTHDALRYVVENEPAVLRPLVAFDGLDPLLARAGAFAAAHLTRFLDPPGPSGPLRSSTSGEDAARTVGEWAARLIVAYGCTPDGMGDALDLTDDRATRRFVATYGLSGIRRSISGAAPSASHPAPIRTGKDSRAGV